MIMLNEYEKYEEGISKEDYRLLLELLNPIAPHITEELNEKYALGEQLCKSSWPVYDEALIVDEMKVIGIQINGKLRDEIEVTKEENENSVKEKVLNQEKVKKYLEGKEISKFIYVPNKIVSILVK